MSYWYMWITSFLIIPPDINLFYIALDYVEALRACFYILQGHTPLFPRIFGHEAGGYAFSCPNSIDRLGHVKGGFFFLSH